MTDNPTVPSAPPTGALEYALASLKRDLSKLSARLKAIDHTLKTECKALTLRLHYPAFRQRKLNRPGIVGGPNS